MQRAIAQRKRRIGRNDVHAVGLNQLAIFCFANRHWRDALQQFGQHGFLGRVEVLHHNIGQSVLQWNLLEKVFQCNQTSRRRANGHNAHGTGRFDRCWHRG